MKTGEMKKGENRDWLKLLMEVIYGVILSSLYVAIEIYEYIFPPTGKSLIGQHAIVTGAARGLGRELCLELAREGVKLSCMDLDEVGAKETAKMSEAAGSPSANGYKVDVTNRKEFEKVFASLPHVDILVNNAGIVSSSPILEVPEEDICRMFKVNVMSHFWTVRAVLPGMIEKGKGHIVAIASIAAFTASANIVPYTTTKYAVTGMMASLREEIRKKYPHIHLTTVHPFFISPPPSSVEHWDKTSRLPDVTAVEVAQKTVSGIKRNKTTITIPAHYFHLLHISPHLPTLAGDIWRDMFDSRISSLGSQKNETMGNGKPINELENGKTTGIKAF